MGTLRALASSILRSTHTRPNQITEHDIRETTDDLYSRLGNSPLLGALTDSELASVRRELRDFFGVTAEMGTVLTTPEFKPWLSEAEKTKTIRWTRWKAYLQWMNERSGLPPEVVSVIDRTSWTISELLGNPKTPGQWERRGLVLGNVQSGKTQNYLAILNRAADLGYRVLIVLAGNTEKLRTQTQERVDEGLVGKIPVGDPLEGRHGARRIGIGEYLSPDLVAVTSSQTRQESDFRELVKRGTIAQFRPREDVGNTFVFVVKKNKDILTSLKDWLGADGGRFDLPILMIDDESDYASVNTSDEDDPSRINRLIREILALSDRSTYLAITATPFANVFIDHEAVVADGDSSELSDLFPQDYIYSLQAPSNYRGPEWFFGVEGKENESTRNKTSVRFNDDAEVELPLKHKKTNVFSNLPETLEYAIYTFVVTNAVFDIRFKANKPVSMLVNMSRFKDVQVQIADLINERLREIQRELQFHGSNSKGAVHWPRLKKVFDHEFADKVSESWTDVKDVLEHVTKDIAVVLYNQESSAWNLDHNGEDGGENIPHQIAIGGDLLSRGITLPNLTTSYFYRRTTASDTLLQMGRWFGYRNGYEDLVRVWLPEEISSDFRYVGTAVSELRQQVAAMRDRNETPLEFGLAVRKHPASLLITARNKMRSSQQVTGSISLSDKIMETRYLLREKEMVRTNREAMGRFIESVASTCDGRVCRDIKGIRLALPSIPTSAVESLLREYQAPAADRFFGQELYENGMTPAFSYARKSRFRAWDLMFVSGEGRSVGVGGLGRLPAVNRTLRLDSDKKLLRISGDKLRLAGGVSDTINALGAQRIIDNADAATKEGKNEKEYYKEFSRPVLMVYFVNSPPTEYAEEDQMRIDPLVCPPELRSETFVALKIIPVEGTGPSAWDGLDTDVKYMINSVAAKKLYDDLSSVAEG